MKKVLIALALFVGMGTHYATAQVSVNINIGSQPLWGPVGYNHVDYYYMPDIETYYYVPTRQYIYMDRGRWVQAYNLPARYGRYDMYNMHKVVINSPNPYNRHSYYRSKYAGYRGRGGQQWIRDSRDSRYYVVQGHPRYSNGRGRTTVINNTTVVNSNTYNKKYNKNNGRGNGHGKGHGNGRGNGRR